MMQFIQKILSYFTNKQVNEQIATLEQRLRVQTSTWESMLTLFEEKEQEIAEQKKEFERVKNELNRAHYDKRRAERALKRLAERALKRPQEDANKPLTAAELFDLSELAA